MVGAFVEEEPRHAGAQPRGVPGRRRGLLTPTAGRKVKQTGRGAGCTKYGKYDGLKRGKLVYLFTAEGSRLHDAPRAQPPAQVQQERTTLFPHFAPRLLL